jgi:sugar transferase (PEP-CTERM/EpsH1 system associated)
MSQPPLIVHVIVSLDVGGLENGLVNLVNHIPASRYRQAIVCLKGYTDFRKRVRRDDVEVFALGKREGKDLGNYVKLWRLFRTLQPDVVHTRNLGTIDVAFPAKLAGVHNVIHGEHGWDVADESGTNRKYRWLRRGCRRVIDRQITVSRHIATWLTATVGVPGADIVQIYNGVDAQKFRPPAAGRAPLPGSGFDEPDVFVVGTVGRMAEIKDPMTLVQAFQHLRDAGGRNHARLRLAMVGDGPLAEGVKHALAGEGTRNVTWLPGRRNDIDQVLRGLDLFVLPSRNEGISNTILEAMATGLPVVATDVGGNPELVVAGRTGTLVPPRQPAAMAAAIGRYVDDPQLAKTQGAAGRRRVLEDFSLETMLNRYLEVYDSVCGPAGRLAS